MISPASVSIRCDGKDRSTGDVCKSSTVLSVDLGDLVSLPRNYSTFELTVFFGARLPGWSVSTDAKLFCPSCKK